MASGRLHSLASMSAATCFTVTAFRFADPPEYAYGAFLGLLLSPDLDVDNGNLSYNFVGRLRKLWAIYWWPYARIMPHRHWLSHAPVISTGIRWFYALWPLYAIGYPPPVEMFIGLAAADTIHFLMDLKIFSKLLGKR